MIAGVDEAGRGCVLGPLVIGLAVAKQRVAAQLKLDGVKDSKELNHGRRKKLAAKIRKACGVLLIEIPATDLNLLMKKRISLNEIEAMRIAKALMKLGEGVSSVYVDSPDAIPKMFERRIRKYYDAPFEIVCENKADSNHPIVAAASIVAKVARDEKIEEIKKIVGFDFGSGYSSDPRTVGYLKKNLHEPKLQEFIRKKWSTIDGLKQRKLSEFEN
ncbi:ribonuclease HII [Candidatus Micrarchaeota archaeon]|nr:MAG: ribonuclease HII [Candidatus Micrarchaeota archaeon]